MQRRYSFESKQAHSLDDNITYTIPSAGPQPYHSSLLPPPPPPPRGIPVACPESSSNVNRRAYDAIRRNNSQERSQTRPLLGNGTRPTSPERVPVPPPHRDQQGRIWGRELGYTTSHHANITPGADNFGVQAAGGIAGIAMGVADAHAREGGLEPMRNTPGYDPRIEGRGSGPGYEGYEDSPYGSSVPRLDQSQSSLTPLGAAAFPPGLASPQARSVVSRSDHSAVSQPYVDNPNPFQQRFSRNMDPNMGEIDPSIIDDDGDDGLDYRHRSNISLSHDSNGNRGSVANAGAAATGGVLGTLGGLVGKKGGANETEYDAVTNPYGGPNNFELGEGQEKSAWMAKDQKAKKRRKCWMLFGIIAVIFCAIVGAIVGGIVGTSGSGSGDSKAKPQGASASDDTSNNGDLDKNSAEIKKLLGNTNLHKVFPGIDYTPMYTQYPDCMHYPPSQNNVTRDLAVISQLTNTIRLYGTDCNQTEMVLHSIDRLGLKDTMKVWMGVWQDKNATTNARQIAQMYDVFDKYGGDSFYGVVVGNEVLFREDMTIAELQTVLTDVKSNLTAKGINLPLSSSDLGDDWTQGLSDIVDYVMANIHPFFAGVTADQAASWTWEFWQNHNVVLKSDLTKHIISETGWPSAGGIGCGAATSCTNGSVAGVAEMNAFMDSWVCQALANGTNYFWFESFDEPWKIKYNEPGKEWEDKWGLMDVNRNLKPGIKIPDCGGKTV